MGTSLRCARCDCPPASPHRPPASPLGPHRRYLAIATPARSTTHPIEPLMGRYTTTALSNAALAPIPCPCIAHAATRRCPRARIPAPRRGRSAIALSQPPSHRGSWQDANVASIPDAPSRTRRHHRGPADRADSSSRSTCSNPKLFSSTVVIHRGCREAGGAGCVPTRAPAACAACVLYTLRRRARPPCLQRAGFFGAVSGSYLSTPTLALVAPSGWRQGPRDVRVITHASLYRPITSPPAATTNVDKRGRVRGPSGSTFSGRRCCGDSSSACVAWLTSAWACLSPHEGLARIAKVMTPEQVTKACFHDSVECTTQSTVADVRFDVAGAETSSRAL